VKAATIEQGLRLREFDGWQTLDARLCWHRADPFEVDLVIDDRGECVPWRVLRHVLLAGLSGEAVDNGVAVSPSHDPGRIMLTLTGDDHTHIHLPPEQRAQVTVRLGVHQETLRRFLARTYKVVPAGAEPVDVDALIAYCLGGVT
jgi:hypothetical protein